MKDKKMVEISKEEEKILDFYRKLDKLRQEKFMRFLESLQRVLVEDTDDILT